MEAADGYWNFSITASISHNVVFSTRVYRSTAPTGAVLVQ